MSFRSFIEIAKAERLDSGEFLCNYQFYIGCPNGARIRAFEAEAFAKGIIAQHEWYQNGANIDEYPEEMRRASAFYETAFGPRPMLMEPDHPTVGETDKEIAKSSKEDYFRLYEKFINEKHSNDAIPNKSVLVRLDAYFLNSFDKEFREKIRFERAKGLAYIYIPFFKYDVEEAKRVFEKALKTSDFTFDSKFIEDNRDYYIEELKKYLTIPIELQKSSHCGAYFGDYTRSFDEKKDKSRRTSAECYFYSLDICNMELAVRLARSNAHNKNIWLCNPFQKEGIPEFFKDYNKYAYGFEGEPWPYLPQILFDNRECESLNCVPVSIGLKMLFSTELIKYVSTFDIFCIFKCYVLHRPHLTKEEFEDFIEEFKHSSDFKFPDLFKEDTDDLKRYSESIKFFLGHIIFLYLKYRHILKDEYGITLPDLNCTDLRVGEFTTYDFDYQAFEYPSEDSWSFDNLPEPNPDIIGYYPQPMYIR